MHCSSLIISTPFPAFYGASFSFLCLWALLPFAYMYMRLWCVAATYPGAHWLRTFCCCGSGPHRSRHHGASGLQDPYKHPS